MIIINRATMTTMAHQKSFSYGGVGVAGLSAILFLDNELWYKYFFTVAKAF